MTENKTATNNPRRPASMEPKKASAPHQNHLIPTNLLPKATAPQPKQPFPNGSFAVFNPNNSTMKRVSNNRIAPVTPAHLLNQQKTPLNPISTNIPQKQKQAPPAPTTPAQIPPSTNPATQNTVNTPATNTQKQPQGHGSSSRRIPTNSTTPNLTGSYLRRTYSTDPKGSGGTNPVYSSTAKNYFHPFKPANQSTNGAPAGTKGAPYTYRNYQNYTNPKILSRSRYQPNALVKPGNNPYVSSNRPYYGRPTGLRYHPSTSTANTSKTAKTTQYGKPFTNYGASTARPGVYSNYSSTTNFNNRSTSKSNAYTAKPVRIDGRTTHGSGSVARRTRPPSHTPQTRNTTNGGFGGKPTAPTGQTGSQVPQRAPQPVTKPVKPVQPIAQPVKAVQPVTQPVKAVRHEGAAAGTGGGEGLLAQPLQRKNPKVRPQGAQ